MTAKLHSVDRPTALRLARYLNELVEADAETMRRILEARIECGPGLAELPQVQTWAKGEEFGAGGAVCDRPRVSLLGILNGFFPTDEDGRSPIAFRVRSDTGAVEDVHLTASWNDCGGCARELEDDDDLETCVACSVFYCERCIVNRDDGPLCGMCCPRSERSPGPESNDRKEK